MWVLTGSLENIDFTFQDWDPEVKIRRHNDNWHRDFPLVTVEFFPSSRSRFQSVSNMIGDATEHGEYKEYGFCQQFEVLFRVFAKKMYKDRTINGRFLADFIRRKVTMYAFKWWDAYLYTIDGFVDKHVVPRYTDESFYDEQNESLIYIYTGSIEIGTDFSWNLIPDDYDGEKLVNIIGTKIKNITDVEYNNYLTLRYEEED